MGTHKRKLKKAWLWVRIKQVRTKRWWRRQDRRYGVSWRMANAAAAFLILAAIALPIIQQFADAGSYRLSADALKLVGQTDPALVKQLSYDAQTSTYQFNKNAIKTDPSDPVAALQAKVGSANGNGKDKSLYALDIPADFSKGATYHDVNSGLSFNLVPQFAANSAKIVDGHVVFPLKDGMQGVYTLKNNGLKEDILVPETSSDELSFDYNFELPKTLEVKAIPDSGGAIGVYSANQALFRDINYGSDLDRAKVEKAREDGPKTNLVFGLPSPVVHDVAGNEIGSARFELQGTHVSVVATGLSTAKGPITIDPSVVVTSTTDFQTNGNDEGNIDFTTSGQVNRAALAAGTISSWGTTNVLALAASSTGAAVYNGYMYLVSGSVNDVTNSNRSDSVQFAAINSTTGTVGSWHYTHDSSDDGTTYVGGYTEVSGSSLRNSFSVTAYDGYLYIVGGNNGSAVYSSVYVAPINANGTIGTWTSTSSMNTTRYGFGLAAYQGNMYAYGGCSALAAGVCSATSSTSEYAPINADGTLGTWVTQTTMTSSRIELGAAVYNGYLYATGGCTVYSLGNCSSYLATSEYAPINADGTLGTWVSGTSFSSGRTRHASVISNGYLYVIGGAASGGRLSDVQYAPISANGSLGAWAATTSFTTARTNSSSVVSNGYVYIIGGCTAATCATGELGDVQYGKIDSASTNVAYSGEGATGTWGNTTSFINQRYGDASIAYNGYLYVLGGYDNVTFYNDVQYAPIASDGTLGAFHYTHNSTDDGTTFVSGFTTGRDQAVAKVYNGYLYLMGGCKLGSCTNGNYLNDVQYAPINANGTLGTWSTTSSFTSPRWEFAGAAYNGYMYIMGGATTAAAKLNDVQYAPINSDGTLGAWHYTHNSTDDGTTFSAGFTTTRVGLAGFAYNGYLYVMGGLSTGLLADVQYAPLNSNGTVGAWHYTHNSTDDGTTLVSGFSTARYLHTVYGYNGYVYLVGGYSGAYRNDVQYAPLNANGTIGTWTVSGNTFANPRFSSATPAYNGYLYLVGGANSTVAYNVVQKTALASIPRIARYSKLVNLGSTYTITQLGYTGNVPGGLLAFSYKQAGSNGVLGTTSVAPQKGVFTSTACTDTPNTQYVFALVTLDDSYGGANGGAYATSNYGTATLYDFTLTYTTPHATPSTRLRMGQTLQSGAVSGLDVCGP